MFIKLNNKDIFFFFKKHFKIFVNLILKKDIKKFLCFHRYHQQIYSLKMYLKGYNYRIRFTNNKRILQLSLGHPLPFYIKLPLNVKIVRLKKKYYRFISNDWSILYNFCFFLRNLRSHFPYKRRGFILAQEQPLRKTGKKSKKN